MDATTVALIKDVLTVYGPLGLGWVVALGLGWVLVKDYRAAIENTLKWSHSVDQLAEVQERREVLLQRIEANLQRCEEVLQQCKALLAARGNP